ncbi:MAG: helix-turn-helix transcriptional regulator [Anaerolineaceae bacterium]|nr:helix-turn-helix transcriptional regulator [Anaerolineaceae bacterium]
MNNHAIGSNFDDFLQEEGILEEVEISATKRILAWEIQQLMESQGLNKSAMALKMKTSRSSLERLLDPHADVTLKTLEKAARSLGKKLKVELI